MFLETGPPPMGPDQVGAMARDWPTVVNDAIHSLCCVMPEKIISLVSKILHCGMNDG